MVDTNPFIPTFPSHLEDYNSYNYNTYPSSSYAPLLDGNTSQNDHHQRRPIKRLLFFSLSTIFFLFFLVLSPTTTLVGDHDDDDDQSSTFSLSSSTSTSSESSTKPVSSAYYYHNNNGSRGVREGVSEKIFWLPNHEGEESFPWTNTMLSWQRPAFHFHPQKNWMNDPDGPLFYKGWYHLFYQYNPDSAVWGNITWGHAVSKDLIHWLLLPIAMVPDHWYDLNGVWTGSATILPNGSIVMIYTGSTNESVQVQNVAFPANHSDPLLLNWVKHSGNPVLVPPPGIKLKDFRDPTTAWYINDKWRIAIGSKLNTTGVAFVYETSDFIEYKLLDGLLHAVPSTGMWECVDFYPVSTSGVNGLDTSVNGPGVKHVLKTSLDDNKHDYYAIGMYDPVSNSWIPDDPGLDVGIGIRYDYGKYYASKTFYDQNKKRRVLWGWIGETDTENADIRKDWSGVQGIPREVVLDMKTKSNLIQWPVEEVERLRHSKKEFGEMEIGAGSVLPLQIGTASQLDIVAEFEINKTALERSIEADVLYNCSTSDGAAGRGILGPFGLLVLADESRTEQTVVYFYVAKGTDGGLNTFFCTDQSRSSLANDVGKQVYGSIVPVLDGERFAVRILVDHSIVEAFAQGGRTCITSRVYPTKAINGAAKLFAFNNATGTNVKITSIKIWQMGSAFIQPYAFD